MPFLVRHPGESRRRFTTVEGWSSSVILLRFKMDPGPGSAAGVTFLRRDGGKLGFRHGSGLAVDHPSTQRIGSSNMSSRT
jgi:hypothetical protein